MITPIIQNNTAKSPNRNRKRLIGWLKILLAALILYILIKGIHLGPVQFSGIPWENLIQSLLTANSNLVILAFVLLIPNVLFQGLRWRYLLRRQTPGVPMKEIIASLFLGWTLGIITPGRVGQFARAFAVPSAPTLPTIGLTFVDKLFTLVWIILVGAISFFSFLSVPNTFAWLWIPLVLVIMYLAFNPRLFNRILQKLFKRLPFHETLSKIISTLEHLNTHDCIIAHTYSLLLVITFLSQRVILMMAFSPLGYFKGLRASAAVEFVKTALPITFGELGIGEAASMHFFGQLGISNAAAFNASILTFCINLIIPSLVGLFFLPAMKLSKKDKNGNLS
jgi:uncharacterized protein (TIRG00374 family)